MNKTQALEKFRNLPKEFEANYYDFGVDPYIVDLGRIINVVDGVRSNASCQGHLISLHFPLHRRMFYDYPFLDEEVIKKVNAYHEKASSPLVYYYGGHFYFSIIPNKTSEGIVNAIRGFCLENGIVELVDNPNEGLASNLKNFERFPAPGQDFYHSRTSPFPRLNKKDRIELSSYIEDFAIYVKDFKEASNIELEEIARKLFFLYEDKSIEFQKKVLKAWLGLAKLITDEVSGLEPVPKIDDYDSSYWMSLIKKNKNRMNEINIGLLIQNE